MDQSSLFSSLRTALSEGLQGGVGQPKVVKGSPLIGPRTRDIYRDVGREARHGFRPYVSSCSLQEGSGDIQVTSEEARDACGPGGLVRVPALLAKICKKGMRWVRWAG